LKGVREGREKREACSEVPGKNCIRCGHGKKKGKKKERPTKINGGGAKKRKGRHFLPLSATLPQSR